MDSGTHDDESVKETHDSECENLVSWLVKRFTIDIAYLEHMHLHELGPRMKVNRNSVQLHCTSLLMLLPNTASHTSNS